MYPNSGAGDAVPRLTKRHDQQYARIMNLRDSLDAPSRIGTSGLRISTPKTTSRAVELALTAVGLGALGHLIVGAPVSPVIVLPALIPVLILSRVLAKRELRLGAILGVLVAGQLWVHTLASLTGRHAATNHSPMIVGHTIATVVAVAILRRREAVTWANARRKAIASYIATLLRTGVDPCPEGPRLPVVSTSTHIARPNCLVIGRSVVRRGPPLWGIS